MESERFDRLTVRLGRQGTRRGLLRATAAGVAVSIAATLGRGSVAATANSVPIGGVCYRDRQCINEYAASGGRGLNPDLQIPYCMSNGFDWDGDMNCCLLEGGFCRGDNECCGLLACNSGFCGPYYFG